MKKRSKYLLAGFLLLGLITTIATVSQPKHLQGFFRGLGGREVSEAEVIDALMNDAGHTLVSVPVNCTIVFTDPTAYYYPAALTACENGWLSSFDPNGRWNRAEVSKIAYKIYAVPSYNPAAPSFSDISGMWYEEYVESLNALGAYVITSGPFFPDKIAKSQFLNYLTRHL